MDDHDDHDHEAETHEGHAEPHGAWDIITDPPHFIAEMFFEGTFLILSAILNIAIVRWRLRKRDREHGHAGGAHDHAH